MGRQVGDGRRPACRRSLMPLWLGRAGPQKCAVTIFEPPLCGGRRAGVREGRLGCVVKSMSSLILLLNLCLIV